MTSEIEIDTSLEDSDYYYMCQTESLTDSINEHIFENGRRYHTYYGEDKNLLPTDEIEQDRLDLHHQIFLNMMDGRLHNAPIGNKPGRILDVGTGTGIWAIDMADTYEDAEVIGMDLTPIQPVWVPPNCRFMVDDAEQEWTYDSETFGFIHLRNITASISSWSTVLAEAYRCLTPGGYIETAELGCTCYSADGHIPEDNPLRASFDMIVDAMSQIGRTFPQPGVLKERLEQAGFVDVTEVCYKQPLGPWPKDKKLKQLGAMTLMMLEVGLQAYSLAAFTRILKMDPAEAERRVRLATDVAKDRNNHIYNRFYVAYGRKPEN
ncbi:S-adenosyl-L-methionine-dependent methyltransferase [Tricharina praecox]|uniref:S-adenosyl-L-methionine-dependent methyltransferase n=1 Tax=Tricharina praecox TaxID=43433 RepID=UPI0022211EA0|nr:S-adenosyl-L-methionine-dependent methyltransferase [Tricharina praecox]KAI5856820.1 S-adenosyl-L-methionine-dependent methyltransferase [Tricharina praecox]